MKSWVSSGLQFKKHYLYLRLDTLLPLRYGTTFVMNWRMLIFNHPNLKAFQNQTCNF